jgi:hypothetical protein
LTLIVGVAFVWAQYRYYAKVITPVRIQARVQWKFLWSAYQMFISKTLFTLVGAALTLMGCAAVSSPPPAIPARKLALNCTLVLVGNTYEGTCEVPCSVNALAINFDGVEPKRACVAPNRNVTATLAKTSVAERWLGTMQGVKPEDPTQFEVVPDATGGQSVARTPFGWFAVSNLTMTENRLRLQLNTDRQVRPTAQDIAIIERAIALLPDAAVWNKNDNRECPPGQRKLSMFCALMQATTELSGGVHYRQPALQAVREVLNTVDASRIKTHRIMDYNNHPDTTLKEIHDLLRTASAKLDRDIRPN